MVALSKSKISELFFRKASSANLQIDSLDGLRGIAVLFVILGHLSNLGVNLFPGFNLRGAAKLGVYLFFVLSSFLLTLPIVTRPASQFPGSRYWIRYFIRRFLRIYPPYLCVLLIQLIFGHYLHVSHFYDLSMADVWEHLILQSAFHIYWAIPVEFKYYFLLPLVAFVLVVWLRKRLVLAVVAGIAVIAVISTVLWPPIRTFYFPFSLGAYLPVFLLGSLTALIHSRLGEINGFKSVFVKTFLEAVAVISFLAVFLLVPNYWELIAGKYAYLIPHPNRELVLSGVLWSLFLFSYLNGRGFVRRVLETRLLRFIGIVSFSAYLLHINIIRSIASAIDTWMAVELLLNLLAILLIAGISHLIIERPFMRLGSRPRPIAQR